MDPHPVIVTVRDNKDYIRVLLCSYYTTITGVGVLLRSTGLRFMVYGTRVSGGWGCRVGGIYGLRLRRVGCSGFRRLGVQEI